MQRFRGRSMSQLSFAIVTLALFQYRLKSHVQTAHSATTRKKREKRTEPRLCPICGKSFNAKNENGFQKHMFHHDPSIGKIKYYQCELCGRFGAIIDTLNGSLN